MRIFSFFFLRSEANAIFFLLVRSESENFSKFAKKKRTRFRFAQIRRIANSHCEFGPLPHLYLHKVVLLSSLVILCIVLKKKIINTYPKNIDCCISALLSHNLLPLLSCFVATLVFVALLRIEEQSDRDVSRAVDDILVSLLRLVKNLTACRRRCNL